MTHGRLIQLVVQVNAALAMVSWPFIIYEALGKKASSPELKEKLDLRRGQILSSVVIGIEEALSPYWPRRANRIVVEPDYEEEATTVLSDAARDAIRACLAENEDSLVHAAETQGLAGRVLRWDRACYWLTFATAVLAVVGLLLWFFYSGMSDLTARVAILAPASPAVLALLAAARRQLYLHRADDAIIKEGP